MSSSVVRLRIRDFIVLLAFVFTCEAVLSDASAAITKDQRKAVRQAELRLKSAAKLIVAGELPEAVEILTDVQKQMATWVSDAPQGDRQWPRLLAPLNRRLTTARAMLAKKGMELPSLDPQDEKIPKPGGKDAPANPTKPKLPTVSYADKIAPVLAQQCMRCHGGRRPRKRFDVTSFRALMRGGMSGPAIVEGKPAESLLIQKLKGTAPDGDQMPLGEDPVSDEVVANFEKWIASGAEFDGPDRRASTAVVASLAIAKRASHEELSQSRSELAEKNWSLALSDVPPQRVTTDNFLIYGSVRRERLDAIAQMAEKQQVALRKTLGLPGEGPLVKGRLTLYVFDVRVDYSEFAFMVEKRRAPPTDRGHWRYNVVDAYGCLLLPKDDSYGVEPLLAEQIAGASVAARADGAPRWYLDAIARNVAARIDAEDPRVQRWNEQLPDLVQELDKPDALLNENLSPEVAGVLGYAVGRSLLAKPKALRALQSALEKGTAFDEAFVAAYGGTPLEAVTAWLKQPAKTPSRPRRRR